MRVKTALVLISIIGSAALAAPRVEHTIVVDDGGPHRCVALLVQSQNGDLGGNLQAHVGAATARYVLEITCRQRTGNGDTRGHLQSLRVGQAMLAPTGIAVYSHDNFRSYETSRFER